MAARALWNANIHYHPLLLGTIPRGAQCVLDVGCGDGILTAQIVEAGVPHVVGLDLDADVLGRARARHAGLNIEWTQGNVLTAPLVDGAFDAVVSVATLHHMDAEAGLARFAALVRPGGVVAVIGLAAKDWWDWPYAIVGQLARAAGGCVRGYWKHSAPMTWPPPATYREMKEIARRVTPGARFRRHLLGRYSLVWTRPQED
jgi:SAM-dependent methyltransferase